MRLNFRLLAVTLALAPCGASAQRAPSIAPAVAVDGDIDGDGLADLVLYNLYGTPNHRIWRMNGTQRVGTAVFTPDLWSGDLRQAGDTRIPGPQPGMWIVRALGDFDQDGWNDLVVQNAFRPDYATFWLMTGTVRHALVPFTPPGGYFVRASADFNHDGQPDLFFYNYVSGATLVWTYDGTTHTGDIVPVPAAPVNLNWGALAAHDYNGDGNVDLLWYNRDSGKVVIWYMDADVVRQSGNFTTPANAGNANWSVVASADYGPGPGGVVGAPDLVWMNRDSGRMVIWFMDHNGVRTSAAYTDPDREDAPGVGLPWWEVVGPH